MVILGNNIMTLPNNANDENTMHRSATQKYISLAAIERP